ncbi:MAG: hypothetical protein OXI96_05215 [Acidimicrobiaceae bacterium]|nr:hypothetical protein [Acidimicrobiaceae bacterium]
MNSSTADAEVELNSDAEVGAEANIKAEPDTDTEKLIGLWVDRIARESANRQHIEKALCEEVKHLIKAGLTPEEALLIAVRRTSIRVPASSETVWAHSKDLWPKPKSAANVNADVDTSNGSGKARSGKAGSDKVGSGRIASGKVDFMVMAGFACAAAAAVKSPEIFGLTFEDNDSFYGRNVGLLVLPMLAGYFAWNRRMRKRMVCALVLLFGCAAIFANVYPFDTESHTETLTAIHLPILLWLFVGVAHSGGEWRSHDQRMGFVRFTGEWLIYYALIALGGSIFTASTFAVFAAIDVDVDEFVNRWMLPCGAAGAVLVAAWLAEKRGDATSVLTPTSAPPSVSAVPANEWRSVGVASPGAVGETAVSTSAWQSIANVKQGGIVSNIAPALARIFTPMFAAMMLMFLIVMAVSRKWIGINRDVLISFDVLLVLVLAMIVYSISARDPRTPPTGFDIMQTVLVATALITDLLVLVAITGRILEFGFSANRLAALGENVVLLVNLAWLMRLYAGFLNKKRTSPKMFVTIERWQTSYMPVYAAWALIVIVVFPPAFGFM